MSIERLPGYSSSELLPLREQVLVKSASIIDDHSRSEKHIYGKLFSSDWVDPNSAVNFHLEALGERLGFRKTDFIYELTGYSELSQSAVYDYSYNTLTQQISKRDERGKYMQCKDEEIDKLLSHLFTAPSGLTPSENATFVAIMHENDIRDSRLLTRVKRRLGRRALK